MYNRCINTSAANPFSDGTSVNTTTGRTQSSPPENSVTWRFSEQHLELPGPSPMLQ